MGFFNKVSNVEPSQAFEKETGIGAAFFGTAGVEASLKAAEDLQKRIEEGQAVQAEAAPRAQGAFLSGADAATQDLLSAQAQAQEALQFGLASQVGSLDQAQGLFDQAAGLTDPALARLRGFSGAGGQGRLISDILGQPVFDQLAGQTGAGLSGLGLRGGRADTGLSDQSRLAAAQQIAGGIQGQTQDLASIGLGGIGAQADILQRIGQAESLQGNTLAQLLGQSGGQLAGVSEGRGAGLSNLIQQAAANEVNLLGQLGQAGVAGAAGAGSASAQGAGNAAALGGGLLSIFSDPSLKKDVKWLGSHKGLGVYSWEWNDKAKAMFKLSGPGFGHMADEVEQLHPHLISRDENGIMKVNYGTNETVEVG